MNQHNTPFLYHWVPAYAKSTSGLQLDRETLSKGEVQKTALNYFKWVAGFCHRDHIKDAFLHMEDMVDSCKFNSDQFNSNRLLEVTLALALMEDIKPLVPYIIEDRAPLGTISGLISDFAPGCEIDLMHQLANKGGLSLKLFCMLYSVKSHDLAIKAVVDDNLQAFIAVQDEEPIIAEKALASVSYDPLTKIRSHIGDEPGSISQTEFTNRFNRQVSALYPKEYMPLINPSKPCTLSVNSPLDAHYSESTDHLLHLFPRYLDMLRYNHEALLYKFGVYSRQSASFRADQLALIDKITSDFCKAGVSHTDILVVGILNYDGVSKEDYISMSQNRKKRLFLPLLVKKAVQFGDNPKSWQCKNKLLQINSLIRLQPIDAMESICSDEAKLHALFRATGDRKYLPMLPRRIDKVFSEDLGL